MAIGSLRHRVVIQRSTTADDGKGGQTDAWATLATVWAEVLPMRGNERRMAGALTAEIQYRVRVRYRTDITVQPTDRIEWGGVTLEVHAVTDEDGRHRFWLLDCGSV